MADTQTTFIKRVISGMLGAAVIIGIGGFGGQYGLLFVCIAPVVLGIREYSRMIFPRWQMPPATTWMYWAICAALYLGLCFHYEKAGLIFAFANAVFLAGSLWLARGKVSNENLLAGLGLGSFGLLYCVLFPFFAFKMARLDQGVDWFFFLLLVVFFGDIFAYFTGRWLGKTKLMPAVSPNKTWEGSFGGILGSCLAGWLFAACTFQEVSWLKILLFCVICGAFAQSGDLLMSLVKRVAHVKDTGHLMPGHGGMLDRLDGIFIACPLVYAFALYVRPF